LYTQFKEKSFIAGLGTNGSNTLPCEKVFCYSGGTELRNYSMAAKTLEQAGFEVRPFLKVKPCLQYKIWNDAHPIIGFSKTYDDSFNPQSAFAAILTCSQADGACPFTGAEKESQSLLKTQKHLIIHPTRRKI
jgi:hypothetical protein